MRGMYHQHPKNLLELCAGDWAGPLSTTKFPALCRTRTVRSPPDQRRDAPDGPSERASRCLGERHFSVKISPVTPTMHIAHTTQTCRSGALCGGFRNGDALHMMRHGETLIDTVRDARRVANEGNIAEHRRLAKPALLQTIVVYRLPRAPLRVSSNRRDSPFLCMQNPTVLHLRAASLVADRFPLYPSGAPHTPGDPTPLPIAPIAASTDRQTHTKNEDGAPFVQEDSRSSLLANAWLSTRDLAGCLRADTSTLRRWRTARPPQGPPFVAVSDRVVMYSAVDVGGWLHSRRTVPRRDA